MKLRYRLLKRRFDQFLENARLHHGKYANLKSILHRGIDRFYRDLFNRWKKNADLLEVIRFNNEEGPVRLEDYKKHAEIKALEAMIKDKMILDDKHIKEILAENEEKYKAAVTKTLGRFKLFSQGINGENNNWILPYCIDKWKLWVGERKCFKNALE